MTPDYMQPDFVFCQPCRYCGNRIEFTKDTRPLDFFCSDACRNTAREYHVADLRKNFQARLERFLADNEAVLKFYADNSGGAYADMEVAGSDIGALDDRFPV